MKVLDVEKGEKRKADEDESAAKRPKNSESVYIH